MNHCPKCHGLLLHVYEPLAFDDEQHWVYLKCVNCGYRTDPTMEKNRYATLSL